MGNLFVKVMCGPDAKSGLIGKHCEAGKDWGQAEKGIRVDEMAGWYHRFNGHEFEQTPGVSEGQGRLPGVHGVAKSQTWLRDQTAIIIKFMYYFTDSVKCFEVKHDRYF